jgi:acyl-CoA thioesterase-1
MRLRISGYLFILSLLSLFFSCSNSKNEKSGNSESIEAQKDSIGITSIDTTQKKQIIVFLGNSLTAGYGLDVSEAFPSLIQNKLDSTGINAKVINAGISGETTASGKSRLAWVIKDGVDVFVLELGANDGLRGIPTEETEKNLSEMIDYVRAKSPNARILLTGMLVPPNMGETYTKYFKEVFAKVAKDKKTAFMPFLLEGVAGESNLNQKDGIHPTKEGHQIIANNLWKYLLPLVTTTIN